MVVTANIVQDGLVKKACEAEWDSWKHDCSGFLKAVAKDLGILLIGQANDIIDTMSRFPWQQLGTDGTKASITAAQNMLVVAGLKATPSGHVAVIVAGVGVYPLGYWGQLHGTGKKNTTINYSWSHADLTKVQYFATQLPSDRRS